MTPARKTIVVPGPPEGFLYKKNIITEPEERDLVGHIAALPLKEFEFHGYLARRRTMSFGWHYKFGEEALNRTLPIPDFLLPLRERAAALAGGRPEALPHVLVSEYRPGTPIGWHRDKAVFDVVVGISLLSRSLFRLRRRTPTGFERYTHVLDPRSIYLLRGPVRTDWEHSIPEVENLRYSITFRSLR
jgi:alkylated DNA repair dioxygenase AlkB